MGKAMGCRDVALRRGLCPIFQMSIVGVGWLPLMSLTPSKERRGVPSDLACGGKSWEFIHGERKS